MNDVFNQYAQAYFPTPGEVVTENWRKTREVAMPAFLHYANTMPLLYREQLQERIDVWFSPFTDTVQAVLGVSVGELLTLTAWIEENYGQSIESAADQNRVAQETHREIIRRAASEGWSDAQLKTAAEAERKTFMRWASAIDAAFTIDVTGFHAMFGDAADRFLHCFAITRGAVTDYFYPTDENPAESHPLFWHDNVLFCPAARTVLFAVLRRTEQLLLNSDQREAYLRHRDKSLENKTVKSFALLLPSGAVVAQNLYETPTRQLEPDIVIQVGTVILIVECKATRQREPFRDPDKAYTRIRDDFRSKNGIQYAYDQGGRLRRRLLTEERVVLYNKDGDVALPLISPTEVFCICVTLEDFGIVATDLSLLLEKDPSDPYPWAVSTFALESILAGFVAENKTFTDFVSLLDQRAQLHGFVFGTDELEFAGTFLTMGGFEEFLRKNDGQTRVSLGPDMSQIFDDIDARKHGIDVPQLDGPVLLDLRAELAKSIGKRAHPVPLDAKRTAVGRNEPCPCGSGKKFKKCHGK